MLMSFKRSTGTGAPPVPPMRHSSIRGSAPVTPNANIPAPFGNSNQQTVNSVGRLITDLESKFGKRFHNVTEFPKPPPFLNIQKIYPSRTVKATNVANTNNNNNSTLNVNNNNMGSSSGSGISSFSQKGLMPGAYQPMKKQRAPAPPPQAGVAAATVSVIRQSSFLYGHMHAQHSSQHI